MKSHASSWLSQEAIGVAFSGNACNFPKGAEVQSTGFNIIGKGGIHLEQVAF